MLILSGYLALKSVPPLSPVVGETPLSLATILMILNLVMQLSERVSVPYSLLFGS